MVVQRVLLRLLCCEKCCQATPYTAATRLLWWMASYVQSHHGSCAAWLCSHAAAGGSCDFWQGISVIIDGHMSVRRDRRPKAVCRDIAKRGARRSTHSVMSISALPISYHSLYSPQLTRTRCRHKSSHQPQDALTPSSLRCCTSRQDLGP